MSAGARTLNARVRVGCTPGVYGPGIAAVASTDAPTRAIKNPTFNRRMPNKMLRQWQMHIK
eukprot:10146962-Alexandrium_andersonii.AAC.1